MNTNAGGGGFFSWTALWVTLAFIAGMAGVGLSFVCWLQSSGPIGLWAAALLLAAPALGVVGTPVECLRGLPPAALEDAFDRRDRTAQALKFIQGTRAALFVGNGSALVLWLCESGGITNARQFVLSYTLICLGALLLLLPWLASRERLVQEALALDCEALKQVKAGREWLGGVADRKTAKQAP